MIKQPIAISRAFGKVVVTVHGEVNAELLRRTLTDLVQDQANRQVIVDLRDAGLLDHDSVAVLVGSAALARLAGGDLVLSTPLPALHDSPERSVFTNAEVESGSFFSGGAGGALLMPPGL